MFWWGWHKGFGFRVTGLGFRVVGQAVYIFQLDYLCVGVIVLFWVLCVYGSNVFDK